MITPADLQFCVHSGQNSYHEDPHWNIITFCPISYWNDMKCLPDYYFNDQMDDILPEGYKWYIGVEESAWCSKKSKDEIRADLTALGYTESTEMEKFLTDCWR